jgi:hypothetical protein
MVFMAAGHRAGMKGGNLVVVLIGRDEALRGEHLGKFQHVLGANAVFFKPFPIRAKVSAHGRHRYRIIAEQFQIVGDVARAAAKFTAHFRNQERHIEDVHLVRQDVVLKLVRKHHDGVISQPSAD